MDRNSNATRETVSELESLGFKVIYPAQLTEKAISKMDSAQQSVYNGQMNNALIVDTQGTHTLDEAQLISEHYFQAGYISNGIDGQSNSVTSYPIGDFKEGSNKEYKDILDSVGYETSIDDKGHVVASSNIPYPAVKKSKFAKIYDNAKGKIQGVFNKLKSIVNTKGQTKENDSNER